MDTKEKFGKVFSLLSAAYPQQKMTAQTFKVYEVILDHLPNEVLQAATLKAIADNTGAWYPSPGNILSKASDINRIAMGERSGEEAYGILVQTSRYDGLPDDVKAALDAFGGWRQWGLSQEGCAATRARFIRTYDTLEQRKQNELEMIPAVGAAVKQLAAGFMLLGGGNDR